MLNNVKNECIEVRLQQHQLTNEAHKEEAPLEDTEMSPEEDRSKIASVMTSVVASTVANVKEVRKKKDSQKDISTEGKETTEGKEEKENV